MRIATQFERDNCRKVNGQLLKRALLGSLTCLSEHHEEVNNLNVFPVPDGDTGTNMLLTLQAAVEDIKDSSMVEVDKVARIAAHGSLMGARGNSGVILSQIFRGFANAVQDRRELEPAELGMAFEEAANAAYRAVIKPTEGTILSVAREAGRAALNAGRETTATRVDVIRAAAKAAREAVERTPTQLKVLREAGVVDAGGYGLQLMLEGMLHSMQEVSQRRMPKLPPTIKAQAALELPEEGWGYCTEFLILGDGLEVEQLREEIAALGNSVLVVGDEQAVKVHVHTDDPRQVINLASQYGRLDRLNVGDMSSQHRRIREEKSNSRSNQLGMVAVAAGAGLAEIFRSLGVDAVVDGGQTMNPSTQDMLQAVEEVPYSEVLLLPNNKNVILAARQVKELTKKQVNVLETVTVPQGLAAGLAFSAERNLEDNLRMMQEAVTNVQTIELTRAIRDTNSEGLVVKRGDVIALVNDRLEHVGDDFLGVAQAALTAMNGNHELVTIYQGQDASESDAELLKSGLQKEYPELEIELLAGGQQLYPFILSVE